MGISTCLGSFNITTGAVNTTQDITDPGFEPTFVIFWWNGQTSSTDAIAAGDYDAGFSFASSTSSRMFISGHSTHAAAASESSSGHRIDACIGLIAPSGSDWYGRADYNGTITGGFQLIIDDVFTIGVRVHYLAIAGTDITDVSIGSFQVTATGSLDVTGPGFEPTGGLIIADGMNIGVSGVTSNSSIAIGAMASATEHAFSEVYSRDSVATSSTLGSSNDASLIEVVASGYTNLTTRVSFSSWLANGFRVNVDEVSAQAYFRYIVWKGGRFSVKSGLTQTDTSTTIDQTYGFHPDAGLVVATPSGAGGEDAQNATHATAKLSIGGFKVGVSGGDTREAAAIKDESAVADTNIAQAVEYDSVYINITPATNEISGLMDLDSHTSTKATFIMDDADQYQQFFWSCAWSNGVITKSHTDAYLSGRGLTYTSQAGAYVEAEQVIVAASQVGAYVEVTEHYSSSQDAFTAGGVATSDSTPSYTEGSTGTNISSHTDAYLAGGINDLSHIDAWLAGGVVATDSTSSYTRGSTDTLADSPSYTSGKDTALDSQSSYIRGGVATTSSKPAYIYSGTLNAASQSVFTAGKTPYALRPDSDIGGS